VAHMTAVAVQRKQEILERVCQGEILREIASDMGVSKQALHRYLKDDPAYEEAKKEQAASMIEEAKVETWAAKEPVDIARAREITKFAFRYAESVDPRRWGQKQEVTHTHQVTVDAGLVGLASDLLKGRAPQPVVVEAEIVDVVSSDDAQAIESK
jgi:hypothetical protein